MRRFQLPEDPTILNHTTVAALLENAFSSNRSRLATHAFRGTVWGGVAGTGDLLKDLEGLTENSVQRSSVPYTDLTDGTYTYRVYRTGRVEPQGGAPPARIYPPLASYFRSHRWPYPAGGEVSSLSTNTEGINTSNITYRSGSGEISARVDAGALRSDETLQVVVPVTGGSGSLNVSLTESGGEVVGRSSQIDASAGWTLEAVTLDLPRRIGYQSGEIRLTINTGGLSAARPRCIAGRGALQTVGATVGDGTALVYVESGTGQTEDGHPVRIESSQVLRPDLARGPVHVWAEPLPEAKVKRAVVTGRDRSETHKIERVTASRVRYGPDRPEVDHLPLARLEP